MATPLVFEFREPAEFFAGDTFYFQKNLPDYLPANGWSLLYEIRGGIAGGAAVQIVSTSVPPGNTLHQVEADPLVTQAWLPGDYVLVGFAVNATGERHQIYYAALPVKPNLGSAADDVNVKTHAQLMVEALETQNLSLAQHNIIDSTVEQTRIVREKRAALRTELAYWKEVRRNEVALENVRNGNPSGNRIIGEAAIVPCGPLFGSGVSWPFSP